MKYLKKTKKKIKTFQNIDAIFKINPIDFIYLFIFCFYLYGFYEFLSKLINFVCYYSGVFN